MGTIDGGRLTVSEPGARDESGSRSLDNNFLRDGIDNNSNPPDLLNEANYVVIPPQEFNIETVIYDAEFGWATSAIVNATTRSGSNQFHGVLYEFLRNQKLDANNYFNTASQLYTRIEPFTAVRGPGSSATYKFVIPRGCDFFDLFVFSAYSTTCIQAPRQSRHPERSALQIYRKQRALWARSRRTSAVLD
jgi:hypothetical protein